MNNVSESNKEHYLFRTLTGYDELVIHLSGPAGEWLARTTKTDDGYIVSNRTLFTDLLSRMSLHPQKSTGFRRSQVLHAGQAQYSELQLQAEWGMGRKVIRRLLSEMEAAGLIELHKSTVASIVTFPCIHSWTVKGRHIDNPFSGRHLHVYINY